MEIKISQVVDLPERKVSSANIGTGYANGYNQALSEVSSLPISKDKVIGMLQFDENKLIEILEQSSGTYKSMAKAIIAAKSDILTIKGDS